MENLKHILIHYNEIALKGKNRDFFEKKLVENIKNLTGAKVKRLSGRILAETEADNFEETLKKLGGVFGISSYSPVSETKTDLQEIKKEALISVKKMEGKTFKVETRRGYKQFALNSMEISRDVGEYVLENSKLKVDVKIPDIIINIEVLTDKTFVYTQKIKGPGGLPVGVSGKMLVLISGGIDSPVASYLMMKRGCNLDFIHFHSYPYTDKASIEKVEEILKILDKYQKRHRLYLAPIIEFQKEIVKHADARYRVILYRRMMYKAAERIAYKIGAKALVSGDNLGQVASQTIENMAVIGDGIKLPIMRPLVGFDKEEIIALAKKIGTFGISIEPQGDCCSVFLPKNPATKSRLDDIIREEKKVGMERWVERIFGALLKNRDI